MTMRREPIDEIPELAAVRAELETIKVPNPPRGLATVEHIMLDGCVMHESTQYEFADFVARWLWRNCYRAGQGVVAAYEASERYLSHECGMSEAWVRQNRRMVIASKLITMPDGNISAVAAGLPIDTGRQHPDLFRIARGPTPDLAMARAVDRLVRNGYRVGMSRVVLVRLLDQDGGADESYEPTAEDGPWLIEFARRLRDQRATPA